MSELHWIRPYWLLALIPWLLLTYQLWRYQSTQSHWSTICDPHLLKHQLVDAGKQQTITMLPLILALFLIIIGLAGPSWTKLPQPTYQTVMPRVILLDMSESMLEDDIKPSRIFRAKLLIRDIIQQHKEGQIALIAYTGMPFVVSPLTQDAHTIETLLSSLTADVMPVEGSDLADALQEGKRVVEQAGFHRADMLVISANPPSQHDIDVASALSEDHFQTSILPVTAQKKLSYADTAFAKAGGGMAIPFHDGVNGIQQWLSQNQEAHQLQTDVMNNVPLWKDEGHWLMLMALLCLIPVFRRGFLEALT